MTQLVTVTADRIPALVTAAGGRAAYRFLEFFTAQIRNPNTRRAYVRAVGAFLTWLETQGVPSIAEASSLHVAAYIEQLTRSKQSAPTVKQQLAAIRQLFDWLAAGGVLPFNPAPATRPRPGQRPCSIRRSRGSSSTRSTSRRRLGCATGR